MSKKYRVAAAALVLVALLAGGGLWLASGYMLSYSLCPVRDRYDARGAMERNAREYPWQKDWLDSLRDHHGLHDLGTFSPVSGTPLHAVYLPAPSPTRRTALLVHGYGCCILDMLHIAYIYHHLLGMNVLMPDLYGHGQSGGDHVNMGWLDRLDVLRWSAVADSLFGGGTRMVLHGISMGAATVMMLSGERTPSCICAYVEDCGYTGVWDEFAGELRARFRLPAFPLMHTTSWLCRQRYGWSFREASSLGQVARCPLPMLFIHGGEDTFVPTGMVYRLYAAKPRPKRIWVSEGSGHARSYADNPGEYTRRVASFVSEYVPQDRPADTLGHEQ